MSAAVVKPDRVAFDTALICAVVALAAIGTIMVTSASVSIVMATASLPQFCRARWAVPCGELWDWAKREPWNALQR